MGPSDQGEAWIGSFSDLQAAIDTARKSGHGGQDEGRDGGQDELIRRFAAAHDLTRAEVREMIQDPVPDLHHSAARRGRFTPAAVDIRRHPRHWSGIHAGRSGPEGSGR